MSFSINKATNANIYADGSSLLGKADEVSLPNPKAKQADHMPLGMVGELEYTSGLEKMETKIKWGSYYPTAIKKFANVYTAIKLQVRWNLETWQGGSKVSEVPCVAYITGRPKDIPGGNFKAKDNVELESNLTVTYYKLEIDGDEIFEVDYEANIYKVGGVDQLANYRAALGI